MKKGILFLGFFLTQFVSAQVSIEKNRLMKDGVKYKFSQYEQVFKNYAAKAYFQKARTNNTVGSIFAATGGAFIGFGAGQLLVGKTKIVTHNTGFQTIQKDKSGPWTLIGIGVGIVGIGIPFTIASKKNIDKAIQTENGEATTFQSYFKLESTGNRVALSYNF